MNGPAEPEVLPVMGPLTETDRVLASFFLNCGSALTTREYERTAREFFTLFQCEVKAAKISRSRQTR